MPTATLDLERVTPNIFTTTRLRGCNPSFVVTSDGVVVIDTPQLPTRAVAMRAGGRVPRADPLPHQHREPRRSHLRQLLVPGRRRGRQPPGRCARSSWIPRPALDPFAYALEAIPTDDPEGAAILPERDDYYADPAEGTVVFTGDLTLRVGDHTIHCLWTPGPYAGPARRPRARGAGRLHRRHDLQRRARPG